MEKDRPFDIAKPRTPKGAERAREKSAMNSILSLMAIPDGESFKEALSRFYSIKPGDARYDAALAAWREKKRHP
jgi:hypothetical protein